MKFSVGALLSCMTLVKQHRLKGWLCGVNESVFGKHRVTFGFTINKLTIIHRLHFCAGSVKIELPVVNSSIKMVSSKCLEASMFGLLDSASTKGLARKSIKSQTVILSTSQSTDSPIKITVRTNS